MSYRLQIVQEPLKPGSEKAYDALEREQARLSTEHGCPHPYLAAETLTGPKEVWWFNAYESERDKQRVYEAYARNARLMTALQQNSALKAHLTLPPIERFATFRADLSTGNPWTIGHGRFLVIAETAATGRRDGTVFEAADGTRFVVRTAQTRAEADARRGETDTETVILAVRPDWSFPAKSWIAADPEFWST